MFSILIAHEIMFSPLDQFELFVLSSYWTGIGMPVSGSLLTNFTVICFLNVLLSRVFLDVVWNKGTIQIWDVILRLVYNLVKSIFQSNLLLKRTQYFSILLCLFGFILISNLVGLIPFSFTVTSSFVVTFFLAFSHFIGLNLIGVYKHNWEIMNLFLPSGVPFAIAPMLIVIEFISYISRVLSLSIRLFANMMSGHALLKILICFSWGMLTSGVIYMALAIFPWILVTVIFFLESLIAFLQAYVFTILITIYINDVLAEH